MPKFWLVVENGDRGELRRVYARKKKGQALDLAVSLAEDDCYFCNDHGRLLDGSELEAAKQKLRQQLSTDGSYHDGKVITYLKEVEATEK